MRVCGRSAPLRFLLLHLGVDADDLELSHRQPEVPLHRPIILLAFRGGNPCTSFLAVDNCGHARTI
jgi:hypothetical protein